MTLPPYYQWLEVEQVGDITVVRFTARTILENEAIEAIGQQLFGLVEAGGRKFVLDFGPVESLPSTMMGKLIALHKRVTANRGRVVLCRVGPFLLEIFKILQLTQLFPIYTNEQEALMSF